MPNTKKTSKNNKLSRAIALNSNKVKLILFLFIFAVIGGGLMLYKSFAYSNVIARTGSQIKSCGGGSYTTVESSSNKKSSTVWVLPKGGCVITNIHVNPSNVTNFHPCMYARRSNGDAAGNAEIQSIVAQNTGGTSRVIVGGSTNYNHYCSEGLLTLYPRSGGIYINISVLNQANSNLLVSTITTEW